MKFEATITWGNGLYGKTLALAGGGFVNWAGPGWYAPSGDVFYSVPGRYGHQPDTYSRGLGTPVWYDGFVIVEPPHNTLSEINPDMDADGWAFWTKD